MYRTIAWVTFVITTIISCRKTTTPEPPATSAQLVIDLHQSALTLDVIDSADVVFRKVGTSITVKEKFVKTNHQLEAALRSLTPGTWNADIAVYTKAVNRQSNQFVMIKPVLISEVPANIQWAGPGATSGNGWLKRHVKASAGNGVVVIVPEEVYDSYFEIRSAVKEKLIFGIQREAINVNYLVDSENWVCTNDCLNTEGLIVNINHFMPFTQKILSHPWTRSEINISVVNNKNEELVEYTREWQQ